MTLLSNNVSNQAIVFGANGGIGSALVAELLESPDIDIIHAVSRSAFPPQKGIASHQTDILEEGNLERLVETIGPTGNLSLAIIATGLLSNNAGLQPEKSYRHQCVESFEQVFRVNTIAPALVAKHILPIMPKKGKAIFAVLSARVGSISDNKLGGWHAYRASKAALNMLVRNYSIEQRLRNPEFIAVSLHPGTVATSLSEPFRKNVPAGKLFSAQQSAKHLVNVLEKLTPNDSGKAFDWAGNEIPA